MKKKKKNLPTDYKIKIKTDIRLQFVIKNVSSNKKIMNKSIQSKL